MRKSLVIPIKVDIKKELFFPDISCDKFEICVSLDKKKIR